MPTVTEVQTQSPTHCNVCQVVRQPERARRLVRTWLARMERTGQPSPAPRVLRAGEYPRDGCPGSSSSTCWVCNAPTPFSAVMFHGPYSPSFSVALFLCGGCKTRLPATCSVCRSQYPGAALRFSACASCLQPDAQHISSLEDLLAGEAVFPKSTEAPSMNETAPEDNDGDDDYNDDEREIEREGEAPPPGPAFTGTIRDPEIPELLARLADAAGSGAGRPWAHLYGLTHEHGVDLRVCACCENVWTSRGYTVATHPTRPLLYWGRHHVGISRALRADASRREILQTALLAVYGG